jgi:hypothetical protein
MATRTSARWLAPHWKYGDDKMAWAATKTTVVGSGEWNVPGVWTPVGVPTIDDHVLILHDVEIDTTANFASLQVKNHLKPKGGAILTVKDAAPALDSGAHWEIETGGYISPVAPLTRWTIRSASAQPAYRVKPLVADDVVKTNLNLQLMEMLGGAIYLGSGDGTNDLWFNTGNIDDGVVALPAYPKREQRLVSHFVEGRNYSRVYRRGGEAGTTELRGLVPWRSYVHTKLRDLMECGDPLTLLSPFVQMEKCIIENYRPGTRDGIHVPFTLTLIEDL